MIKTGDFEYRTKWISQISFFALLLCFSPLVFAKEKVAVQATVDRNELGPGDTLTLSVNVRTTGSVEIVDPKVPDLQDFELINTWAATSSSAQMQAGPNGVEFVRQSVKQFNYMLAPQKNGKLEIGAFEINVDGTLYRTAPILIEVSEAASGNTGGGGGRAIPTVPDDEEEDPFAALLQRPRGSISDPAHRSLPKNPNEAFFIQVELDKTEVFEGEQVLANWYIYTRGDIMQLDRLKFPDLKGFWKEDIDAAPTIQFTQEVINGVPYRKALLGSYAMFPIKVGDQYVDEYKIKAVVRLPLPGFGGFGLGQPYTYTRSSEKVKIKVKPLPTENRPRDFAGAVGQYAVSTIVDGQSFPAGQPFILKLRFEGEGNAKLIELPEINLPPTLELYDKKAESKFFRTGRSYKEFEILLIPREPGELIIPPISFSFFNPQTKKYETRTTQPITVQITASVAAKTLPSGKMADEKKAVPAQPVGPSLPTLVLNTNSQSWHSQAPLAGPWAGIYLAILFGLLLRARQVFQWGKGKRDLRQILSRRLKKVYKLVDTEQYREVGREMINAVYGLVGEMSSLGGAGQELARLLDELPPSMRREVGEPLTQKMELFQMLAFAPEEMLGELKQKSKLKENVKKTEKLLYQALSLRSSDRSDS